MLVSGGEDMTIYLDQAFALNSLLDYLLLRVCGTVTATPKNTLRLSLGAAVGGLYAVASLLPGFRFLGKIPWQMAFAGVICLVAFGPGRGLLRRTAVLLLLAAAFSGVVLALTELFRAPAALVSGRVYYPVSFGVLVLTAGGAFSLMQWALSRMGHQGRDIARVTVRNRGRQAAFTALRDTGNTLHDPISGLPVMVAEGELLKTLAPDVPPGGLDRPAELLETLHQLGITGFRLIPYRTVGVERGMLLAFRPEEVEVDGKKKAMLMAFSPGPVSDGNGCTALLGGTE